ncbi:MAG: hypothetical protein LBF65_03105 [Holosporales bacterium]|nr:hypothetical protein [Holosporales bacterium]
MNHNVREEGRVVFERTRLVERRADELMNFRRLGMMVKKKPKRGIALRLRPSSDRCDSWNRSENNPRHTG